MRRICPQCETHYDDMRCFILCPHEKRGAAKCHFCAERAVAECSWPAERFVVTKYANLNVGDRIKHPAHSGKTVATVLRVGLRPFEEYCELALLIGNREEYGEIFRHLNVRVARAFPCALPVCEAHLRNVADEKNYCADHWHAWEAVA